MTLSSQTAPGALRDCVASVDRRLVMSALDHDQNADRPAASVPPGTGDPQEPNELRRIHERIAALTKQHETSWSSSRRPFLDQRADIEPEFVPAPSRSQKLVFEEEPHGAWMRTLDPFVMPPPPQNNRSLLSRGRIAGFIAAFCVAAGIALAITDSMRAPIVNAAVSRGADTGQSQSLSKAVLANLTQIRPAEARVQSAEQPTTPALAAFAALRTNDAAPPQSPAATSPSAQPSIVMPQPAALAEPPTSPILSREETAASPAETAAMLQRGRDLIAAGDIASARLILQHLAEAGSAEASLALAGTFDPVELSKLGAIGLQPDLAKARAWYAKAAEQGSREARQRLQQSALR
ncbi:hypothetical protein [Bradyrhizobium sp.]|uniref:hypothetical protein n=1 Tax=Bradyrhizobium sp. TaxID=376 RepID=UPI003C4F2789